MRTIARVADGDRGTFRGGGVATYDSTVLEEYASELYRGAKVVELVFTLIGVVMGAIGGYSGSALLLAVRASTADTLIPTLVLAGGAALLGALLGWLAGRNAANAFRLRAQVTLCQVQIERNTRH
jgi:hypothetical protein